MSTVRTIGPVPITFSPPLAPGATQATFWKLGGAQPQNFTFTVTAVPTSKNKFLSVDRTWVDTSFTSVGGQLTSNPVFHAEIKNVGDSEVRDCKVCVSVVEL
jgi:hypothetical protein